MKDMSGVGASPAPDTFVERAKAVLDQVDTDNDGFASESELDAARSSRDYSGHDAAAVEVMFRHRSDIEEVSNDEFGDEDDGVTAADLDAMSGAFATQMENAYSGFSSTIDNANHSLYPHGRASITASAVHQGGINDCYFLSAV